MLCIYSIQQKKWDSIYTGVTSDLVKRIWQHKNKVADGFTKRYNINKLGYYEVFVDIELAILREKQIKNWQRKWKISLIEKENKNWNDLYHDIIK